MKSDEVIVADEAGLHARPASMLVKSAKLYTSDVSIEYQGKAANAKSIMALMKLGVKGKAKVRITAQGEDEEIAVTELVKAIESNFK
ncbi:phosphotransferase system phosphocarrier protein HPr [Vibrio variabilis]|uniref:Phosphotransferase system phosphocarrier protein HPr n=1 Tax=Vibrio variabilis TaxID=990271 RepID=A0ABQ0JHI8_9VIBR|nr:phosphotransferase system phosphocarrier protein HPr [Vibrio variabilis]